MEGRPHAPRPPLSRMLTPIVIVAEHMDRSGRQPMDAHLHERYCPLRGQQGVMLAPNPPGLAPSTRMTGASWTTCWPCHASKRRAASVSHPGSCQWTETRGYLAAATVA